MVAGDELATVFYLLALVESGGGSGTDGVGVGGFGIAGAVDDLWGLGFLKIFEQGVLLKHKYIIPWCSTI